MTAGWLSLKLRFKIQTLALSFNLIRTSLQPKRGLAGEFEKPIIVLINLIFKNGSDDRSTPISVFNMPMMFSAAVAL